MAGTSTRTTMGPVQRKALHPVSSYPPIATKAKDGTIRPMSQR